MPFTDRPWDGSASRWPDAAAYCKACLVDNNAAGAEKVKAECHFPVREPDGTYNVGALRAVVGGRGAQASFPGAEQARATARRLLAEYQGQQGRSEEPEQLSGGEPGYRACDLLRVVDDAEGNPVLEGRMMPYDEWTEINSRSEGHFMERFAPGSLAKTMKEQAARIRVLFEHGEDRLGRQPIATVTELRDEPDGAYYRAELLRGLPDLIVDGLRRGVYGTSIRWGPVKWDRRRSVEPSESNPQGLPEHTIREARLKEFSVVTFPAYAGATAHVRSLTDEMTGRSSPEPGEEPAEATEAPPEVEPQHSEPEPGGEPDATPSRSTRPSRDYLNPKEAEPSWRL